MKISRPLSIQYTVESDEVSRIGDSYIDSQGHIWWVRDERSPRIALRGPDDWTPKSMITLESTHPAHQLEPGEILKHNITRRCESSRYSTSYVDPGSRSIGWEGYIDHQKGIGFGDVLPLDEIDPFSWCVRKETQGVVFMIGPRAVYYNYFDNPIEKETKILKELDWDNVSDALIDFIESKQK
jgi:hypothetical protein